MSQFMIEDVKVGVTEGGFSCGPMDGHVIAEARVRNMDDNTVVYHSLAEVEGTLNFTETFESTFDIQMEENYDDKDSWAKVSDNESGGYSDYYEFYEDLKAQEICDEDHLLIWKYLAYLVRAEWPEVERMKADSAGKCLGSFEIPVCDAEQDYLDGQAASDEEDDDND